MRLKRILAIALTTVTAFAVLTASPARSQEEDAPPPPRELIHSDLPLFQEDADMWPRPYYTDDEFGCSSRIAFGDWVLREAGAGDEDQSEWYRIHNYGVFHCFALFGRGAYERQDLDHVALMPSFFVFLGTAEVEGVEMELWAIQVGMRPGSDYVLLLRPPNEGMIDTFSVLQTECPRANVRDAGAVDIVLTRYCAINTQAALLRLARRMARRPPIGTLALVRADQEAPE